MTSVLTYPSDRPENLSADAAAVYRARLGDRGRLQCDPFERQPYWVPPEDANAYAPSERVLSAVQELARAGLATYDHTYRTLQRIVLHPLYTVAHGRGAYFVQVRVVRPAEAASLPRHSPLLATIIGADFAPSTSHLPGWQQWRLRSIHPDATDFEHDPAYTADLDITNPVLLMSRGGYQQYAGTLTAARLYPMGADPLQATDGDHPEPRTCADDSYGPDHLPHPIAPYMPPERADVEAALPAICLIDVYPLRAYTVEGPAPSGLTHR